MMHKEHEIYMREFCVGDPMPPIFHLLVLGVGVWGNANFSVHIGVTQILAFLDTNMLVSPTRNCGVGDLSQHKDPTRMVLRRSGIQAQMI